MKDIGHAVDRACATMRKWKDSCEKFVHDHRDTIIDDFKNNMSPKQICYDVGICHKKTVSKQKQNIEFEQDRKFIFFAILLFANRILILSLKQLTSMKHSLYPLLPNPFIHLKLKPTLNMEKLQNVSYVNLL